ncbi:I78 family peptidase inhibitor [Novosphingobium guangzhouense]|uniref:Peptidase inhibitor I78 n=1 Tax=Novosphingobium guangzhouense TaxID=1850347 RepID=A0A2K2G6G6_9SPHN|nr:hypothetical protein A8V01_03185 [Novosphingobium guangzhouense]
MLAAPGCVTADADRKAADSCSAAGGQAFVGRRADADTGLALLKATRSRTLRWIAPPQTVVTTEYQPGRVTVDLDGQGIITNVNCG